MAISKTELESLIERAPQGESCVLSVYLDVDQSRAVNLNRGYVRSLKEMLRACEQRIADERQRKNFAADAEHVLEYVSNYGARARTLVMLSDASENFFWSRELFVPIPSRVRYEDKPCLRPLVEALDEHERNAIILVDRERGRLFTMFLGEIEEHRDVFSPDKRKYFKKTSKDTTLSQPNLQRKEEEHALWHLKLVAEKLEDLGAGNRFDRLILAGPHELTTELQGILSKKLQSLVVRSIPLPIDAGADVVLKAAMRIEEEVEREAEVKLVEQLITAAAKDSHAVVGLQPTLDAWRSGRIMRLVYDYGFAAEGSQCTNCSSMFAGTPSSCSYCGGVLRPVPDVVARLADMVLASGGHAENVRGAASERLNARGHIGAFLRF